MVTTFSIPVFAQGIGEKVLDLNACINTAMENSYIIKTRESILEKSQKKHNDDSKIVDNLRMRMKYNDRFDELANTGQRTEAEESEYRSYISMFGKPMSNNEFREALKTINSLSAEELYDIIENINAVEIAKNNVKQSVYEEYESLIKALDNLQLEEKKLKITEQEFKNTKLSSSIGVMSRLEEKEKEKNFLEEKENYEKLKREFHIQTMNFNRLIGAPIGTVYNKYSKEFYVESLSMKTYEEYVNEAMKNRAEIVNGKQYIILKKDPRDTTNYLFSKYDDDSIINEIYYENAKNMVEIKKLDIQLEIKKLYDDIEIKYKNYETIKEIYKEAKDTYDEISRKYSLGMVSKFQYDKETISFYNELLNYRNSERDIYIAKLKLENACGLGTDINKSLYNDLR